jgi:CO dehydrogenase/acetyl-CoA synthase gamma subunit (corrinoid Fe-S protein)
MPKESAGWSPEKAAEELRRKYEEAFKQAKTTSLSWSDADPADLQDAIAHVTEDGVALLLAKTSDGGALMAQALIGAGHKPKFYAASQAELNELLAMLARV